MEVFFFLPYEWGRGVMINTNEMTVYFYQMCGRRARDNLTLSRGNVSSCVCGCNKTSAGFFPAVSADCAQCFFFHYYFYSKLLEGQEKQKFQSQTCGTVQHVFRLVSFPHCAELTVRFPTEKVRVHRWLAHCKKIDTTVQTANTVWHECALLSNKLLCLWENQYWRQDACVRCLADWLAVWWTDLFRTD